jgi:predicted amidohydrolase
LSSVDQSLHGYADLCCQLYDELDDLAVVEHSDTWLQNATLDSLSRTITADVCRPDGRPPGRIYTDVVNFNERNARIFAALRGLDTAFQHVNERFKDRTRTPASLATLEAHVQRHGRLDSGAHGGALIPRLASHGTPDEPIGHKRDLMTYVQRVPAASWDRIDHRLLGLSQTLNATTVTGGFDIACVPVIAEPTEIHITTRDTTTRRFYRVTASDAKTTLARIPRIVDALDASGAHLAVAPEATLTPAILERWRTALRAQRADHLRYVLVGSGNLRPASRGPRAGNTAVLLDGRTGAELGRQHKIYPFNMTAETVERWKLTPYLGDGPVVEDLAVVQPRMTIFELGAIRLGVVVCEDLNKPLDLGPLIRDLGISHLLAPVFSRPVQSHRWEDAAAAIHARETGTAVAVSNSMIMGSLLGVHAPGTSIVIPPDGSAGIVGHASDPATPVVVRLNADGSAELR